MSAEDLAGYRSPIVLLVTATFRDLDIFACGPWCQGPVLPQTLNILNGIDLAAMGQNSADYIHTVAAALNLAFADRHAYYGDPEFVDVPIDGLLDPAYANARRALINNDRAWPEMAPAGDPYTLTATIDGRMNNPTGTAGPVQEELDTSYICVVDGNGNAFSGTPSDGSTSAPVVPGLGIVVSTRGSQNWTDPDHPACVAPGKCPRLTPNPAMAVRDGRWLMPFGSPGNDVQIQAMVQALMNMVIFGMSPQDAVEQPRFASFNYPRSSEPHSYSPGQLRLEGRIADTTARDLAKRGHKLNPWPDWEYAVGAVCTIVADRETGILEGASDPRRPTGVAGW